MNLSSTLESVVIYREGAVCTRRAAAAAGGGKVPSQVRLTGLPLALTPGSLRAAVLKGGPSVRVLDVRAAFDVQLVEELDVPAEAKALEAAREAYAKLEAQVRHLAHEIQTLEALRPKFPQHKVGEPPREANVEAVLALSDFSQGQLTPRYEQRQTLDRQLEAAQEEVSLREHRLQEATSARRTERAKVTRCAVVTLSEESAEPLELSLEYQVPGARWVPGYELRLDRGLTGGTLRMRASIAQKTGEDWTGVSLALSTASLNRRTALPELKALKLGRSQPPPPRSGWREPPPGLDELFGDADGLMEGVPQEPATPPPPPPPRRPAPRAEPKMDMELSKARAVGSRPGGGGAAPRGAPMAPPAPPPPMMSRAPAPASAPMKKMASAGPSRSRSALMDRSDDMAMESEAQASFDAPSEAYDEEVDGFADEGTGSFGMLKETASAAFAGASLLDYDRLTIGGPWDGPRRGRLHPAPEWDFAFAVGVHVQVDVVMGLVSRAVQAADSVSYLSLPANCVVPTALDSFDYRYQCEQRVDVPSTDKWVVVPVMGCNVGLTPELVCVPAVEPKVYRTLQVKNSSSHALLEGPVDASAGDEFLMTTTLPAMAPGAEAQRLGLGVEESVKVARKTQFKETAGGLLGGSTVLPHDVEIEINNRLSTPARIEIRERVPVPNFGEKDLKIEEAAVTPMWDKPEAIDGQKIAGARRWKLTVPPGQKQTLTAQYVIRIPSDRMLVGGNRRD